MPTIKTDRLIKLILTITIITILTLTGCGGGGGTVTTPTTPWGVVSLIENDNAGDAYNPQIAFSSSGIAIAVWEQYDGARANIYANTYTESNNSWGSRVLIENDNAGAAYSPQIAFGGNGTAVAVWSQRDGAFRNNIYANTYTESNNSWGSEVFIENDNAGNATDPQIAFNSSGTAVAVWEQHDGTRYNIYANTYTESNNSWGSRVLIENNNAGDAYDPQIAFGGNGTAVAIWRQHDGTRFSIYANTYTESNNSWGSEVLIESDNAGGAYNPQIAFNSSGTAVAVWRQSDGTRNNIYANTYTESNNSWGSRVLIENDNAGAAYSPQIAFGGNGTAVAVWEQYDGTFENIYANTYIESTNSWGSRVLIKNDNAGFTSNAQITFDRSDNAIAVWEQYDGSIYHIYSNTYTKSTNSWGSEVLIENNNAGDASNPQIVSSGNGTTVAVWTQNDGSVNNINSNVYK